MQPKHLKIVLIILALTGLGMLGYILYMFQKTAVPVASVDISSPTTKKIPAPERAFIQLGRASTAAQKGGTWSINITTNTWAKCLADVYDPSETVVPIGVKKAEATFISPGKFEWVWDVPSDAAGGKWTIRMLCGTFDNLATADQTVTVQ
jgi:hypothetical protein